MLRRFILLCFSLLLVSTLGPVSAPPAQAQRAAAANSLGHVYLNEGKFDETEHAFKRALTLKQTAFGPNDPTVADTLDNLAKLAAARDQTDAALDYSRKAIALVLSDASLAVSAGQTQIGGATLIEQGSDLFRRQVVNLAMAARKSIIAEATAGHEAFELAQWASHSSAAAAVAQLGVRFAAGNDALAALIRESRRSHRGLERQRQGVDRCAFPAGRPAEPRHGRAT